MKAVAIKAILSGVVACLLTGSPLHGAVTQQTLTWDWALSDNGGSGSGTFTTEDTTTTENNYTGYLVTSMDGLFDGDQVTLIPPGDYDSNDNLLGGSDPQVSGSGISFSTASTDYNIFYSSSESSVWVDSEAIPASDISKSISTIQPAPAISDPSGTPPAGGSATFTANTVVPEPGMAALSGLGAMGLWYFRRRK